MSDAPPAAGAPAAPVQLLLLTTSTPSNAHVGQPVTQFYEMALPDDFDGSPRAIKSALGYAMRMDDAALVFSDPEGGCVWLDRREIKALSLRLMTKFAVSEPEPAPEPEPPAAPDAASIPNVGTLTLDGAALGTDAPLPAADSTAPAEPTLDAPAMAAAAAGDAEPQPAAPASQGSEP